MSQSHSLLLVTLSIVVRLLSSSSNPILNLSTEHLLTRLLPYSLSLANQTAHLLTPSHGYLLLPREPNCAPPHTVTRLPPHSLANQTASHIHIHPGTCQTWEWMLFASLFLTTRPEDSFPLEASARAHLTKPLAPATWTFTRAFR
jgi:hypothetical protein